FRILDQISVMHDLNTGVMTVVYTESVGDLFGSKFRDENRVSDKYGRGRAPSLNFELCENMITLLVEVAKVIHHLPRRLIDLCTDNQRELLAITVDLKGIRRPSVAVYETWNFRTFKL